MAPEFSYPVRAGSITEAARTFALDAPAAARDALAARFGIPAIAALRGRFTLAHAQGGVITGTLALTARATLTCVVSLEPFDSSLTETTSLRFVPGEAPADLDPETLDGPDEIAFDGETIDLGEVLAEQLALALPAYPRKPGAALPAPAQDETAHPFAALLPFKRQEK
jgi:uncharacterized metal-binding protein YceD (DUF177 family)